MFVYPPPSAQNSPSHIHRRKFLTKNTAYVNVDIPVEGSRPRTVRPAPAGQVRQEQGVRLGRPEDCAGVHQKVNFSDPTISDQANADARRFFFPRRLKEVGRDDPVWRVCLALLKVHQQLLLRHTTT